MTMTRDNLMTLISFSEPNNISENNMLTCSQFLRDIEEERIKDPSSYRFLISHQVANNLVYNTDRHMFIVNGIRKVRIPSDDIEHLFGNEIKVVHAS